MLVKQSQKSHLNSFTLVNVHLKLLSPEAFSAQNAPNIVWRPGRGREEGVGREGGICVIGFRGGGRHWLRLRFCCLSYLKFYNIVCVLLCSASTYSVEGVAVATVVPSCATDVRRHRVAATVFQPLAISRHLNGHVLLAPAVVPRPRPVHSHPSIQTV